MQSQSLAELEQAILQLPLEARIALLQTLALSLSKPIPIKRRTPPPELAGKIKEIGDIMQSIPETDWNLL